MSRPTPPLPPRADRGPLRCGAVRRALSCLLLMCGALGLGAQARDQKAWVAETRDTDTVDAVWTYMKHKDCAGAARVLNDGVKKELPSVLLLAGAMFEDGICLKPNWERALGYYERARAAGHPRAAGKIAAGFATPAAGPDRAAALWWSLRDGKPLPPECREAAALVDDADRFIGALRAWPRQQLEACAYVAGVLGAMSGDLEFSRRAAQFGLSGVLTVSFHPAEGRFDIVTDELDFVNLGGYSGDAIRDRESRSVKSEFERDIRAAADRALKRYERPAGIDPSWRSSIIFSFGYVLR
jgi:hypothetical protein